MAESWYYVDDTTNAQQGPCTIAELGKRFSASTIRDSTLVWRDGQPGWEALSAVSSLHAQVVAATRGGPPALPAKTLPALPAKPRGGGGGGGGRNGAAGGAYAAAQANAAPVQSMSGEWYRLPHRFLANCSEMIDLYAG